MKKVERVLYKGKVYVVLADHFCRDYSLLKLASNHEGGAPFTARKEECFRLAWSSNLGRLVTIPA